MARIIPLTGSEKLRQICQDLGLILANELHTTSNQRRLFLQNTHVGGPVFHGPVIDETAMVALNTRPRGVWPMDLCYRVDRKCLFLCINGHGIGASDWLGVGDLSETGALTDPTVNPGDIIYRGADGTLHRLPIGPVGQFLGVVDVGVLGYLDAPTSGGSSGGSAGTGDIREIWLKG